ncbi:MAG: proton-conducting transporter membrane subunit, partial [Pseudomonadota bacterium]
MEQVLLLAPMTGALVAGLGWRLIGETAVCWISTTLILIAATLAWFSMLGAPEIPVTRDLHIWMESGSLSATIAFRLDRQYAPLIALVTSLAAILHIVTLTYFRNQQDEASPSEKGRRARLCAGLGGMTVALVLLLAADDMAQFLAGWVGIGLACYIISGLNLGKAAAGRAAQRVALTLRAGELLLLILVGGIFALTDTLRFDDVFQVLSDLGAPQVTFLGMDMPAIEMLAAGL